MENSNTKGLIWGLVAVIVVVIGAVWVMHGSTSSPQANGLSTTTNSGGAQACTTEALICPDGTAVGRTGPNCEFAPCPPSTGSGQEKTRTDLSTGVSFNYPATLGKTYISTVDWPPADQVVPLMQTCTAAGSPNARAGQTQSKVINGRTYCVTLETEGAAGSTYYTYAYAFPKNGKTVILTFSLRYPQCGNYNEPNQSACKADQASFNVDQMLDTIAQSVKLTS